MRANAWQVMPVLLDTETVPKNRRVAGDRYSLRPGHMIRIEIDNEYEDGVFEPRVTNQWSSCVVIRFLGNVLYAHRMR
jgi:hypothetical protein